MKRKKTRTIPGGVLLLLVLSGSFGSREIAGQNCPTAFQWDFGRSIDEGLKNSGSGLTFDIGLFLGWELDATIRGAARNDPATPPCVDYTGAPGGTFAMDMGLEIRGTIGANINLPFPVPDINFSVDLPGIPTTDLRITDTANFNSLLLGSEARVTDSLVNKCVNANLSPIPGVSAGLSFCGNGNLGFVLRGSSVQNGCGSYTGAACQACAEDCPTITSTWRGSVSPTGSLTFEPCIFVSAPVLGRRDLCLPTPFRVPLPIPGNQSLSLPGSGSCELTSDLCQRCTEEIAQCRQQGNACRNNCISSCANRCSSMRSSCRNRCNGLSIFRRPACLLQCEAEFAACGVQCAASNAACRDNCDRTEGACIQRCVGGGGTQFRRGDCTDDGRIDISDALCGLGWLFLGDEDPVCIAALNATGDAGIDITDPIAVLEYLFLGGPEPVPPFPGCGEGNLASDARHGCVTAHKNCP